MAKRNPYTTAVKTKGGKATRLARLSGVRNTPQTRPIPGRKMVQNNAGGFGFKAESWARLDRFLILGSEGGSYYVGEQELINQNVNNVLACIKEDGVRVVRRVVELVTNRRCPKMNPPIFVLGLCMKHEAANQATRQAANKALVDVAKIGTHLFDLAGVVNTLGGWSSGKKGVRHTGTGGAFARWYNSMDPRNLAYQVSKYQQRNGWSHRDILRLSHPKAATPQHNEIFQWITGKLPYDLLDWIVKGGSGDDPKAAFFRPIEGLERAKLAVNSKEIVQLIKDFDLVREAIPTQFLNDKNVWEALLDKMPYTATLRNLGKMSEIGLISPLSDAGKLVVKRLTDRDAIVKSRVHPVAILTALMTYSGGHGFRSDKTWTVNNQVRDALDDAFYASFANVEPTGLNFYLGIDVSGSMSGGQIAGMPNVMPSQAAAAMALVTARREPNHFIGAFNNGYRDAGISARDTLATALPKISNLTYGGTDAAVPIQHAIKLKAKVDAFVIYSDGETWAGNQHVTQALRDYRNKFNPKARLVVVNFVANRTSMTDPDDPNALDIVGFDTSAPEIMRSFLLGEM